MTRNQDPSLNNFRISNTFIEQDLNGKDTLFYSASRKLLTKQTGIDYKDTLPEELNSCILRISKYRILQDDLLIEKELNVLQSILDSFILNYDSSKTYSAGLYHNILNASDELVKSGRYDTALEYLEETITAGIDKYPSLKQKACFKMAMIFADKNDLDPAHLLLSRLIQKPYLMADRNSAAEIIYSLSMISLRKGYIQQYKHLLFLGLKYFYTDSEYRKKFFEQIRVTYGRSLKIMYNGEIDQLNRLLYLMHWLYFRIPGRLRRRSVTRSFLGLIYLVNYSGRRNSGWMFSDVNSSAAVSGNSKADTLNISAGRKILITRAMGGIGDLLMMTPGINALRNKYPDHQIHLAIPKRYFPLFEGNKDIYPVDIESDSLLPATYSKWFNLTDCPASRIESRTAPGVKKDRIRIFSNALGVSGLSYKNMDKRPRYFISELEKQTANEFIKNNNLTGRTIIGVQLHSDETYRDFPYMEELVKAAAMKYSVIVFNNEIINGYSYANVIKAEGLSFRKAAAIASGCNVIIAPDSAFIHLAAAFDIPSIGLFGPIDGKVRTAHYAKCTVITAADQLGCLPCWRNESIPCRLTGLKTSICMSSIELNRILSELDKKIAAYSAS